MTTFAITGKEPHEPTKDFTVVVKARNESHAKKYCRWLHALGRRHLTATPTNEPPHYIADRF